MNNVFNPNMLMLAREASGLSQIALAAKLGVTQGKLSKIENGFMGVNDEMLQGLSQALHFPREFFFESENIYPPYVHYYRKAKSMPSKLMSRINAQVNIERIRVQKLIRSIDFDVKPLEYHDVDEYGNPEAVASELRQSWRVPRGPIKNMTELIESAGIFVMKLNFGTRLLSDITVTTELGKYIIFVNSLMPGDRLRFTLTHALGHVIMQHLTTDEEIEREADRFAGEFLMPKYDIQHQLTDLTLEKLANLKTYWKVSMNAILMRAQQLNKINEQRRNYLWARMSKLGFRLNEPIELSIPKEVPSLLLEVMKIYLKEYGYTGDELKKMLYLRPEEYPEYGFTAESHQLRLIKHKP